MRKKNVFFIHLFGNNERIKNKIIRITCSPKDKTKLNVGLSSSIGMFVPFVTKQAFQNSFHMCVCNENANDDDDDDDDEKSKQNDRVRERERIRGTTSERKKEVK